jgi:hypothetical protein
MTFNNIKFIIFVDDDNNCATINSRIKSLYPNVEVGFVHTPIGGNNCITMNGLYDYLSYDDKNRDEVIVIAREYSTADLSEIKEMLELFKKSIAYAQAPILSKRISSQGYEWRDAIDFSISIAIAERKIFFDTIERFQKSACSK